MATENYLKLHPLINVYMYVNKDSGVVEDVQAYHIFGISRREDEDWLPISRQEANLEELTSSDYRTFVIDWNKDPDEGSNRKLKDIDVDNRADWEHPLILKWDSGDELTVEDVEPYSVEINTTSPDDIDMSASE